MFRSEWHGLQPYKNGEAIQQDAQAHPGVILGFEFEPVITLGRRGSLENDVATPAEERAAFELVHVERGGHATLHSHGQLVIYPVLDLRALRWGVKDYLCWLQRVTKATLLELGIEAREGEEPGLYTDRGKIAFFGVRVQRGLTQHGVSVNVANQADEFRHILSCGVQGEKFDRVLNYDEIGLPDLFAKWCANAEKNAVRYCDSLQISREEAN